MSHSDLFAAPVSRGEIALYSLGQSTAEVTRAWEHAVPDTTVQEMVDILGKGLKQPVIDEFYFSPESKYLSFTLRSLEPAASLSVSVDLDKRQLSIADAAVEAASQGKGTGKKLIGNLLAFSDRLHLENWELYANKKGSYSWAKFGFKPKDISWKDVAYNTAQRLRFYKRQLEETQEGRDAITLVTNSLAMVADDKMPAGPERDMWRARAIWAISDLPVRITPISGLVEPLKTDNDGMTTIGKAVMIDHKWFGTMDVRAGSEARERLISYTGLGKTTHLDKVLDVAGTSLTASKYDRTFAEKIKEYKETLMRGILHS